VDTYGTDPNNVDSDGDGLIDGDEVNTYGTDPADADTDDGSVNDGTEIENGTDPLDGSDDVPVLDTGDTGDVLKAEGGVVGGCNGCATAPGRGGLLMGLLLGLLALGRRRD